MKITTLLSVLFIICMVCILGCKWEPIELPIDEKIRRSLSESCNNCADELKYFMLPSGDDLSSLPQDLINNPLTTEKVKLGKLLFHETAFGQSSLLAEGKATYSCASCHYASAGFQANRFQGLGEGGYGFDQREKASAYTELNISTNPIRPPSILNVAYQDITLWNGSLGGVAQNAGTQDNWIPGTSTGYNALQLEGIETQAISGIELYRMDLTEVLIDDLGYKFLFDSAFDYIQPDSNRYSNYYAGLSLAAFERSITTDEAPFQLWLNGDLDAMTANQKEGALLFFGKAGCVNCHNGPALNGWTIDDQSSKFEAIGMKDLFQYNNLEVFQASINSSENNGRGAFNNKSTDNFKFKTPQLYNLKDSPFYGHGSSFTSIKDVITYKNQAQPEKNIDNISPLFIPLELTENEVDLLVEFIEQGLHDPTINDYQPGRGDIRSGNCIPNNDELSKVELGCN